MATRISFLKRTLQVLLLLTLILLAVDWLRKPDPNHLANLGWSAFLLLTILLLGPWWGNRTMIRIFESIVIVVVGYVAVGAYARTEISKKVHVCFQEELKANTKTQLTSPEMREILNRSVGCAEKRINSFERFFWDNERAKNSIKVTPVK